MSYDDDWGAWREPKAPTKQETDLITQEYIKSIFSYNPETGICTRIISKGAAKDAEKAYKNAAIKHFGEFAL